jgi:hypothetical protein
MKRILFVGLIALLVLLAVPAAMAATSQDVTITGTYDPAIDVSIVGGSATPSYVFTTGLNTKCGDGSGMPTVRATVTGASVTSWAVVASTPDLTGFGMITGKMWSYPPYMQLGNYFQITKQTDSLYNYIDIPWTTMSGSSATTQDASICMQQQVDGTDATGSYQIAIAFAGTVS